MKLEHDFAVPAPVDEAWKVLLDVERVAPCMPGATLLTVDGDDFTGTVKVKVGPIQVTYKGQAKFAQLDESAHRAVIEAHGKEARGTGTAAATVTAVLEPDGSSTKVKVETDLNVTGRPAQFGRGVMEEVAAKLIGQFADCLAKELGSGGGPSATGGAEGAASPSSAEAGPVAAIPQPSNASSRPAAPPAAPAASAPPAAPAASVETPAAAAVTSPVEEKREGPRQVAPPARPAEPIDLLDVAGGSVAKRVAPIAAVLAVLLLLLWRRRHRE